MSKNFTSDFISEVTNTWTSGNYTSVRNKARNPTIADTSTFLTVGGLDANEVYEARCRVPLLKSFTAFSVNLYLAAPIGNVTGVNLRIGGSLQTEDATTVTGTGAAAWYAVPFSLSGNRSSLITGFNVVLDAKAMPGKSTKTIYAVYVDVTGLGFFPVK